MEVFLKMKNAKAQGEYDLEKENVLVKEGALFEKEITNSFRSHNYFGLRNRLLSSSKVKDFILQEDFLFESLSAAAAVIGGRSAAGPREWKTKEGITIKNYLDFLSRKEDFIEYMSKYNGARKNQASYEEAQEFKELFPIEKIGELELEDYDKIGSSETFCYYIEHKTREISGGSFWRSRNKLFFNQRDGSYENANFIDARYPNKSIEEKFSMYKEDIYNFITNFDKDNYVSMDYQVLPQGANYIKSKLINIYHTNELLCIDSVSILRKIANFFGISENGLNDSIEYNIAIIKMFDKERKENQLSPWDLSEVLWQYYQDYIDDVKTEDEDIEEVVEEENTDNVHEDLFMSDEQIKDIVLLLEKKMNLILQGSPGVGKTFSIDKIIKQNFDIEDAKEQILMIQFHQSFSYEEFIEGLRPNIHDNGFDIKSGIFKLFIDENVKANPNKNYFLIIDEINRGNLSKIFGELLLLIEKDKRGPNYKVKLPYSNEYFYVPKNLYIIGTMNTADRSLALIDYALRRRFSFVDLKPMFDSEKFNDYLNHNGLKHHEVKKINDTMTKINHDIRNDLGENFEIGHSYFVDKNIHNFEEWYEHVMKYDILPLLKEYYFDDEEKYEKFLVDLELK